MKEILKNGIWRSISNSLNDNFTELGAYGHMANIYSAIQRIPAFFKRINPDSPQSPYNMLRRFVINSSPDAHGSFDSIYRLNHFIELIKDDAILSGNTVKAVIMQGDTITDRETKAEALSLASDLADAADDCSVDFLTGLGNHDMNTLNGNTTALVLSKSEQKQYIISRPMQNVNDVVFDVANENACYWYKDYDEGDSYKVRIVMLDMYDMPQDIDGDSYKYEMYYNPNGINYSDEQINWLAGTALNLPSSDWHVIVFGHQTLSTVAAHNNSHLAIQAILDAYAIQGAVDLSNVTTDFDFDVDVDFSSINGFDGNLIGYFYGHGHIPIIAKITINGSEYNNIELPAADDQSIGYSRIPDTGTLDMSTFIVVDTEDRNIFLLRYGIPCNVDGNSLPFGDYGIDTPITY